MQYSIVNYKTVKENSDFRIDAEYFRPEFLELDYIFFGVKAQKLGELTNKIDVGYVGLMVSEYDNKGVLLLQTQNVREFFLETSNCKKINLLFHKKLKKSQVKQGDVLIARSGSFGQASIYLENEIINSADIIIVEPKKEFINPFYLVTFLNSKFGVKQLFRFASGGLQGHVNLTILENLQLPLVSMEFQNLIENIILKSYLYKDHSKSLYSQAEELLLSELGLSDWKPKHTLTFVKNFSDTQKAERMDAEYFQPKYEEIIEAVKRYKGGFDELGNLVKIKKSVEPGSEAYQEEGVPFVRVSNLSKFELSTNNQQFISEKLHEELKTHQPKKGEILLSKDATPGIAYYLSEEPRKMIVSGGILRLRISNQQILPEYLTLVLNSIIVQKQIERDAGGSIINHWRPDQVKKTLIPILKEDKQKEIKELIEKSFSNRSLSKSLLEIAKRGVEIAIEKDEQEAEKWIREELRKIKIEI